MCGGFGTEQFPAYVELLLNQRNRRYKGTRLKCLLFEIGNTLGACLTLFHFKRLYLTTAATRHFDDRSARFLIDELYHGLVKDLIETVDTVIAILKNTAKRLVTAVCNST